MSAKMKRPKNPTIQNFLPPTGVRTVSDSSKQPSLSLNDFINNNRIPRVSINATSQLCVNQDARSFPYMRVSTKYFVKYYLHMLRISAVTIHK